MTGSGRAGTNSPLTPEGEEPGLARKCRVGMAWVCGVVVVALALGALLENVAGVPEGLRPWARYRAWRAERFHAEATQALNRGDLELARVGFESALGLRPEGSGTRVQLARIAVEEGRYPEAAALAASAGMDPTGFIHDALLRSGRFEELLRFSLRRMEAEPARRGAWFYSLLLAGSRLDAARREAVRRETRPEPVAGGAGARWLAEAAFASLDRDAAGLAASLGRLEGDAGGMDAGDVLAGLELWLGSGDATAAWVWLNRHRARLGDFDARLAELRVEQAKGSGLAPSLLRSFAGKNLNERRWSRLIAAVAEAGDAQAALELAHLAEPARGILPASVCASLWAVLMARGQESAAETWDAAYRRSGRDGLPLLAGRALASSDDEARARAVRLLAEEAALPRELMQVFLRPRATR